MNAITPANEMPPDQSTAASGMFPTEQTKDPTATSGPTTTFSSRRSGAGASCTNAALKTRFGTSPR
ncbi:MAG TPA: hypothetical protein VHQ89_01450 [Gaiellaceae bacterium]|nr:hypothetical protein [Gaiellaceae bacterium]